MKTLLLLVLIAFAAADVEWQSWKMTFNRQYSDELEELHRYNTWQANKKFVECHNKNADKFGFNLGMNQFADLENHEFVAMVNGYKDFERANITKMYKPTIPKAAAVDWRTKGAVTGVKYQGQQCGSCWAFSATGALEGQHFLKKGKLVSLSEQNLVDCSGKFGNNGCNGGYMDNAFEYIKENGGIDTEESYPYKAHEEKCKFNPNNVGAIDTGFVDIPSKDENALTSAVEKIGPISVAIDASHVTFQLYHSGIYYEQNCSETTLDHGVLAIGYGTENGSDYWLVKNSWSTSWGIDGYIKMARNRNNNCGIATSASYPTI